MSVSVVSPHTATADSAEPALRELWISFVSLTRSHLAALQTTGKLSQATVVAASPNLFILGDLEGNIAISYSAGTGRGAYEMKSCGGSNAKGVWQLFTDGTACVDEGRIEDMELIVETLAGKLLSARSEGIKL